MPDVAKPPTWEARLAPRQRPSARRVMLQNWRDVLFMHWPCDARIIRAVLPPGLYVDTYDGTAFLGVVPLFMRDVRPWMLPRAALYSDFMELNFRTYVYDENGVPGIWFFSLDAANWLAVEAARRLFHLPYFHADMESSRDPETGAVEYYSLRAGAPEEQACIFSYAPASAVDHAEERSFEFFLLERYVLFAWSAAKQTLYRGRVHHTPYPICEVDVSRYNEELFTINGFARPQAPPVHVIMSPGVDVEVFAYEEVARIAA